MITRWMIIKCQYIVADKLWKAELVSIGKDRTHRDVYFPTEVSLGWNLECVVNDDGREVFKWMGC